MKSLKTLSNGKRARKTLLISCMFFALGVSFYFSSSVKAIGPGPGPPIDQIVLLICVDADSIPYSFGNICLGPGPGCTPNPCPPLPNE